MKHFIKYTIILLITLSSIYGLAQDPPPPVIDLPTSGGSMIGDIIHANGKIFCYGADGVSVFSADDNSFLAKIPFEVQEPNEYPVVFFGKFNPVYYDGRLASPDQSMMVYNNNEDNPYVYIITPKLELLVIDADPLEDDPFDYWITSLPVEIVEPDDTPQKLSDILDTQSGVVILKYDNTKTPNRLYALVAARHPASNYNCIGNFHVQKTVFGIYNVDPLVLPNNSDHTDLQYVEINAPDLPTDEIYGNQINNFVFNEDNDYYYVVRLGERAIEDGGNSTSIIEIREFGNPDIIRTINFANTGDNNNSYFKMGKMLYINDQGNNIHKVLVFPFRYFVGEVESPKFYMIDCESNVFIDDDDRIVNSASKKILDAVYLEGTQDLVLSYAPDDEIVYANANTNVAVYTYNTGTKTFVISGDQFTDDNSAPKTSDFDINAALQLTKLNSTTALISKKDGIAKLEYSGGQYDYSSLLVTESNFYRKGAIADAKVFFNNTLASGFEVYDTGDETFESIRTGYPVYHIAANVDGSNMYFYNKLNAHDIGFYSYQPSQTPTTTHINIETAIGDIVYNPFQDHFLVSKFDPDDAEIQIAEIAVYDASSNMPQTPITITGAEFVKEMFISPNGQLYVCANMNNKVGQLPKVFVFDATSSDYNSITEPLPVGSFTFGGEAYDKPFAYYSAHFEYNDFDRSVYITMAIQDLKLTPYNSVASRLYQDEDGEGEVPAPYGKILVVKESTPGSFEKQFDLKFFPGKIICPDMEGNNQQSQYYGKLFIIGKELYEYDYLNPPTNETDIAKYSYHFIDIVYSPIHDKLFAVEESTDPTCPEYRTFKIWSIYYDDEGTIQIELFNNGMTVGGQIASFFYNPNDMRIYAYRKIDGAKLGNTQVSLMSFDPENPSWTTTELGITSYFPEYDHTVDLAHFWFNNTTTPYINPNTNKIYLPNGGHSNVSVVDFEAREFIPLNIGETTWLSVPRHIRPDDDFPDLTPTDDVFKQENITGGYTSLKLDYLEIISGSPHTPHPVWAEWDWLDPIWHYDDENASIMKNIHSARGYKLDISQDNPLNPYLLLEGSVQDPDTEIPLFCHEENWIGYFLYKEQRVFEALGDAEPYIYYIKWEDRACWRHNYPIPSECNTKSANDFPPGIWICDGTPNIKYSDMIIVKSMQDIPDFSWQQSNYPPSDYTRPEVVYYTYDELADYSTFVIELDTTQENPEEMGAFVNDTCMGACSIVEGDSVVVLRAYLGKQAGDSVVFQEHYTSKSTNNINIVDYYVLNPESGLKEKRVVKTGEGRDVFIVSFRKGQKDNTPDLNGIEFKIWPNPASGSLFYSFMLEDDANVNISIFDIAGKIVGNPINEPMQAGSMNGEFTLTDFSGGKLKAGVYFVKLNAGDLLETKKVIVR